MEGYALDAAGVAAQLGALPDIGLFRVPDAYHAV
jgi:hypothetical protein